MTPRLEVATHIYARLIVRDLRHAIEKPQEIAHRALLFADALLLGDQQSAPVDACDQPQHRSLDSVARAAAPDLAERLAERRDTRSTLH